ncbi:MAG: hypothetical protein M1604_00040 [Patescibacteria group bacterium]|nr:hypothetical protein [Patescibacteria group bacterium]
MKKLKLYGKKSASDEIDRENAVAVIYVTGKKELMVESAHPEVKRDIEEAIVELIKKGGPKVRRCVEKNGETVRIATPQKLGDADFLEALREEYPFWSREFSGYEINHLVSRVADE